MSISANYPTSRPALNLNFARSKVLDPRITFTRASSATYYDGVTTAKAEENLLLQSQDYSATWTVTNLTPVTGKTAPDATSTATEFTATAANAVLTQGYTAIAGSYTFSVFLRRVTGTGDIQIAADNGTWTTKVITSTWARYDVTQTVAAGSKTAGVRVVTNTDVIEVWGAQLEQRSSVTSYTATTTQPITNYIPVLLTAANNQPRFDHNPTTGESLGLLIEEQRTNLLTYSEEFDNAAWAKTDITISPNVNVSPDGTLTTDLVTEGTAGTAFITRSASATVSAGATVSALIYVKRNSIIQWIRFRLSNSSATNGGNAWFDIQNGSLGNATNIGSGTATSGSITSVGNGWYRIAITTTLAAGDTTALVLVASASANGSTTRVNGAEYFIWGAQLEAGAFPTSYIKTVAATVTRSPDAASMTGTNFSSWYNQSEGTLFADGLPQKSNIAAQSLFDITDGTSNTRIGLIKLVTSGIASFVVRVSGVNEVVTDNGEWTFPGKLAGAYKVNDFAAVLNGTTVATDTSGAIPVVNRLDIGWRLGGVSPTILNGHIRRLAYYPLRLTNAQLQALTT